MFLKKKAIARRRFILGLGGLAAMFGWRGIAETTNLVSRLENPKTLIVNGKEVFRVVAISDPTNSVWALQQRLSNSSSWTNVATSNSVAIGPGKIQWDVPRENQSTFLRAKLVTVTIKVQGTSYEVPLITGQTLEAAMRSLMAANQSFTFVSEKRDWGQFVTTINGIHSQGWIFTANGVQEPDNVGISAYIIKIGDIIEWSIL